MDLKIELLRFLALFLLLPGLTGLVADASLATHYFNARSRTPEPALHRNVPRSLNGEVVYLTPLEDQQLDLLRYYGLRSFGIGIALGLLYLGAMSAHLERFRESGYEIE